MNVSQATSFQSNPSQRSISVTPVSAPDLAHNPQRIEQLAALWNSAAGPEFALSTPYLTYRLASPPSWPQALATVESPRGSIGLILVHAPKPGRQTSDTLTEGNPTADNSTAFIDAWAVQPQAQQQGLGRALVAWAETWAAAHGSRALVLGNGPLRLLPGVPAESSSATACVTACSRMGFAPYGARLHDLACDLTGYLPPDIVVDIPGLVRPVSPSERAYLDAFLRDQASDNQRLGLAHFLATGGRMADIMALWTETELAGALQISVEDSAGGIEPWFPYDLPKPWAALRLITPPTLPPALQWALLDAALRRLHNTGVNSCILAGVEDPEPYTPFGFRPYHAFQAYVKELPPTG